MKKSQKDKPFPKVERFSQNVSVDTLNAATTNSTDFFREISANCCGKTKRYYQLLRFWRQLLSLKTSIWQMEYSFDNPAFLAKEPETSCLVPEKTSLKFWRKYLNHVEICFKKNKCSSKKQQDTWITVLITLPINFCQNPQKNSQCQKKNTQLQNFQRNWSFHKWPSQSCECCFEGCGKAFYWREWKVLAQSPNLKLENFQ